MSNNRELFEDWLSECPIGWYRIRSREDTFCFNVEEDEVEDDE